jgi:histidine triad (HIT) family protein
MLYYALVLTSFYARLHGIYRKDIEDIRPSWYDSCQRSDNMTDCLFCKIINGELPATKVYENRSFIAFEDIDKKAPTHILIVPKTHIESIDAMTDEDTFLMGELFQAARDIAKKRGVAESGYRVVINTGRDGGQTVSHLHMHLLGGRAMTWPPG